MEIVFIRHTEVDVPAGMIYGQMDVPLKDTFPEETKEVQKKLAPYGTPDLVYSSPLTRCRHLANACGYPDHLIDHRLKEINFGEWEGKTWGEIDLSTFGDDGITKPAPGGESLEQMYQRVTQFIEELPAVDKVFIFAHGGVLNLVRCYFLGLPLSHAYELPAPYGTVVAYTHEP